MTLKFIGANGSMGLTHGKKYKCNVSTLSTAIVLQLVEYPYIRCPYSSPQSFADNWASPYVKTKEELIAENDKLKREIALLRASAHCSTEDDADCYCE